MRSVQAILFDYEEPHDVRTFRNSVKPSKQEWERWIAMRKNAKSNPPKFKIF